MITRSGTGALTASNFVVLSQQQFESVSGYIEQVAFIQCLYGDKARLPGRNADLTHGGHRVHGRRLSAVGLKDGQLARQQDVELVAGPIGGAEIPRLECFEIADSNDTSLPPHRGGRPADCRFRH